MKKYEILENEFRTLDDGTKIFRIRAICSFGNVDKGEKGGFVQRERNLSQNGNAWVYGNARVSGNAEVSGNARVYGNAWVSGDAEVSGDALVYDNAWVSVNASVYGDAWVSGDARVYGNARVSDRVINLIFKEYSCTLVKEYIAIGCQNHTYERWKNFNDYEIAKMDGPDGLQWWHKYKDIILSIWENNFL